MPLKNLMFLSSDQNQKRRALIILIVFVLIFCLVVPSLFVLYKRSINPKSNTNDDVVKKTSHDKSILASIFLNDPTGIQNNLVNNLKNNVNDKYTKADAYFITHRFFDNGGNIYEIYDYVNSHPELSFLKEAEKIYPTIFEQIKNKTLTKKAADYERGLYADLAYIEVLVNHGYSDMAGVGTLANQYAKLAFYNKEISLVISEADAKKDEKRRNARIASNAKKSKKFLDLATEDVKKSLLGKINLEETTTRDVLVGLNQYASALRYLDALVTLSSTSTEEKNRSNSKKIFAFTMKYSRDNVPELLFFTSLLNASTLAISPKSTEAEIKTALYPVLDIDLQKFKSYNVGVIQKVLDSRFEQKPPVLADMNIDMYSKRNTIRLADKVPDFKKWLKTNGWEDKDFRGWQQEDFK